MQASASLGKSSEKKYGKSLIGQYIKSRGGLLAEGSFDVLLFIFLSIIIFTGLTMLYSASYPNAYTDGYDPSYYFKNQAIGVAVGVVLMMIIGKMNHMLFMEAGAVLGSLVSIGLLVLALFMGGSDDGSSIKRWITIAGIRFQPSDIAKFTLILTLAYILHRWHYLMVSKKPLKTNIGWVDSFTAGVNRKIGRPVFNESWKIVMGSLVVIGIYVGLVFLGSHLSGAIIMLLVAAVMLFVGEIRPTWIAFFICVAILMIPVLMMTGILSEYMVERITNFLSTDKDLQGGDWQTIQALYAIGSGGFFGKGLGQSVQKYNYVPEPQNDMIFAIIIEELGFIGGVAIIVLFALVIWRGIVIGVNSPTRYGALVAFGITFKLALQVFFNIGVATDIIPNTGITLPFFSYGRTALIVNLVEMGILFSISRASRMKKV
ncbi:MAG: cell division protein FtsW [Clostridia bacterium]|nr:cell division protein FtsW [Clostridia bacterium]